MFCPVEMSQDLIDFDKFLNNKGILIKKEFVSEETGHDYISFQDEKLECVYTPVPFNQINDPVMSHRYEDNCSLFKAENDKISELILNDIKPSNSNQNLNFSNNSNNNICEVAEDPGFTESCLKRLQEEIYRRNTNQNTRLSFCRNKKLFTDLSDTSNSSNSKDDGFSNKAERNIVQLNRFKCLFCSKHFSHSSDYVSHLCAKDNCSGSCNKRFTQVTDLKRNAKEHVKEIRCRYCQKQFEKNKNLTKHMKIHTGGKPFSCSKCGKRFTRKQNLSRHTKVHMSIDDKPFIYKLESEQFTQVGLGLPPSRVRTRKRKEYVCKYCDKRIGHKHQFTMHLRMHTGEKPFSCSLCNKNFARKHHLMRHLNTHTNNKVLSCSQCNKRFTRSESLVNHKKLHEGIKSHECEYCIKKFISKKSLRNHLQTHVDEKPSCLQVSSIFKA